MTSSTPLQIPFTEIKSVTNDFSDASVIGEGFLGKIYGGQLSLLSGEVIDVAIRRSDHSFWLQDTAFDKEFKMLSRLEHKNLVSNVGYCIENGEMIIINKRVARGSLNRHLSGTKLNWKKRLEISVGVASALSYLHNYGAPVFTVIHRNVSSTTILLDEKWEAKLSGFEYSMTIPAGDRDLVYEKLGIGSYKSDVFSFGIVLFEILCGTKAFISTENNKFQAQSAIFHFEGGKLHELVDPDLFKQMDPQSFHIFSEIACNCLKKQASLNMIQVLTRLKRALKHQEKHENKEEHSTVVRKGPLSKNLKLKLKHLEHMRIQLKDILSATENFASKYCIVSGGFGMVYSAVLEHVDREYCYAIEGKNEHEVPKRRSKVAVKCIFDREDDSGEQGFYAEVEILTSCKHSNILTLLGFCDEGSAMILVYEYASNGSLADCLQNKSNMTNDSWAQRIKICLQVAKGLNYLHTSEGDRQEIVHRDIKSANILLDENLDAKIGDFGLCKFLTVNEDHKTEYSREIAGTEVYMDPQYAREGKLKKELDIYSFGVVMFEILCGKVAFDQIYTSHNKQGLALIARWHFEKGTVKEIVDPRIKEGITEPNLPFYKQRDQNSVDTFTKIAYQCLSGTQDNRPSMANVIKELEEALRFQKNQKANLLISLKDIRTATQNFNDNNIIRVDGPYKIYKGEVLHTNGHTIIDVKRLNPISEYKEDVFSAELKVLMEHTHENLIGFVGYCDELDEKIIVYEHGSLGSLDEYLDDVGLTWRKRLKICVDIASGLDFLHGGATTKEVVIHRNIKSGNIQLDGDFKAKIADFGFSVTRSLNQEMVFYTSFIKGTDCYMDPQYKKKGLLSKECDIYSMGVVLFEIMSGKVVYSSEEIFEYNVALGPLVRRWHKGKKLDEMVFKKTKEQIAPKSLAAFQRIVIQCLHDRREERPTAGEVVTQLKKALEIQEKGMDIVRISFEDIKLATDNFSDEKCLGSGGSGKVYIGQLPHANGQKIIAAKQMDGACEFYKELEILAEFRHKNVIGLEGCCDEMDERIIVYEYQSKGSLARWLNNINFSWVKRLSVCIDIANGLNFLHGVVVKQEAVIHKDIRSSNIILSGDWKAKIALFGLSSVSPLNQLLESDNVVGTLAYRDPQYASMGFLTKESDIYSLGVVLFEILCGRLTMEYSSDNNLGLAPLVRNHYEEGKLSEMVFEGIRKQILPESLITFAKVAYQCLHDNIEERPTASEVMIQLEQALESQEDCDRWEPKLPSDYKDIINMSKTPKKYYNMKKKDLFNIFSRGIRIQEDKVLFLLRNNGRRNKVISPTLFSYENKGSLKWRHRQQSIFRKTSMMLDASNLQIRIQINTHLLSPGVMYMVLLAFKFGDKKKTQNGCMYVNLKYKKGNETLHAYFARLHDGWMFINLYEFLNEKEDDEFEVLLESFSRYYCGSGAVYFHSIQLSAIENVEAEEIEELKEDQQVSRPNSSMGQLQKLSTNNEEIIGRSINHDEGEKLFELNEVNGKIHYMLCAKEVLYDSSNRKLYNLKPSEESRFRQVVELLPQQVSGIKYKIEKQKLSPNTLYGCYLVFKLSEKCRGLHCPVKIRDILDKNGKLYGHCYFRSPAPWNSHLTKRVPKQREDGWMEVMLHSINPNEDLKNEHFPVNLKLISFEGTMSGLIVEGLEFRPMEN